MEHDDAAVEESKENEEGPAGEITGGSAEDDTTGQGDGGQDEHEQQQEEEEETGNQEESMEDLTGTIEDALTQGCNFDAEELGVEEDDVNLRSPNIPNDDLEGFSFGVGIGEDSMSSSRRESIGTGDFDDESSNQNVEATDGSAGGKVRTGGETSVVGTENSSESFSEVDHVVSSGSKNSSKVASRSNSDARSDHNNSDNNNNGTDNEDEEAGGTDNEEDDDGVEVVLESTRSSGNTRTEEKLDGSEEEETEPIIKIKSAGLFAEEEEEEEENAAGGPNDIHNMMQVDMAQSAGKNSNGSPTRPRRAAAAAAADVIRETISNLESEDGDGSGKVSSKEKDKVVGGSREDRSCHICKKTAPAKVTVRQYGEDIYFCTTTCFNVFRNPDSSRRSLPCAKCGIIQRDNILTSCYYWETMNFCSDLCVGNYQMEIGARCATCGKKVAWGSLGKYCVRFGSDVRQFCTSNCLEAYKKNARVCFHCQLDIKKLSNVILANIPAKTSPKEFCSQDCVEMYIEQNLHQTVRHKPNQNSVCIICSVVKPTFRELVVPIGNFKVCSETCWTKLLEMKNIRRPVKCEICAKYVDLNFCSDPKLYVSTHNKVYGFCSPTCKNVYVLRSRQILACTSCKVKKYNYDLIEHINEKGRSTFAVCSLNCIPKPSMYILNLRDTLTPAATASEMLTKSRALAQEAQQVSVASGPSRIRTQIVSTESDKTDKGLRIVAASSLSTNGATTENEISRMDSDEIVEIFENPNLTKVVTDEEMDDILESVESCVVFPPKEPKEQRNKGCLVRPYSKSVAVQADAEDCSKSCQGGCKGKERYVPIIVPIFVPVPFYALESPVPIPLPVPLPVPIPIPLVLPTDPRDIVVPAVPPVTSTSFVAGNGLQTPQTSMSLRNTPSLTPSTVMTETISMDPGFLDLAGPNVGESDSFDILNTIPNLDVELGLGPGHHNAGVGTIMNQNPMITDTNCPIMGAVMPDPTANMHWRQPVPQQTVLRSVPAVPAHPGVRREDFALNVWREFFGPDTDPLMFSDEILCQKLKELVEKGHHASGERFQPSFLLYMCLGLQQYVRKNSQRNVRIFYHNAYESFVQAFVSYTEFNYHRGVMEPVIDESHFWESNELGVNSPEALLFTLIYYNYKYFNLRTWQEHESLTFNHFVVGTKLDQNNQRYKYLSLVGSFNSAANIEVPEMEPQNKCFVKLYEFYKFKCVSSAGPFYKAFIPQPPSKGNWYSADPLSQMAIYRMLIRAMMIKS